jgi:hypothetical protein
MAPSAPLLKDVLGALPEREHPAARSSHKDLVTLLGWFPEIVRSGVAEDLEESLARVKMGLGARCHPKVIARSWQELVVVVKSCMQVVRDARIMVETSRERIAALDKHLCDLSCGASPTSSSPPATACLMQLMHWHRHM